MRVSSGNNLLRAADRINLKLRAAVTNFGPRATLGLVRAWAVAQLWIAPWLDLTNIICYITTLKYD